jgi:hypothetical protein
MITKERLEETIRGVIREFKRTKRITDPAADELAAELGRGLMTCSIRRQPSAIAK